ncbi:MAG: FtsX-like permease family protein [Gammaproteobacteria bacterium]|nr:FtsX-like permease family protein [Gammaproteobacteria bacterium]
MTILIWLKFAWKNIWRNRRRSLTTIGITSVGVSGLLFFGGFALFTYESLEEFSARQQGHVIIAHADYFDVEEETPMSLGLDNWRVLREQIETRDRVRRVLPRIEFSGLISNGDKSSIFIADGVDARYEFTVTGPFMNVSSGDVLNPEHQGTPQIMLASELARQLKAEVGSTLTLLSTTAGGVLNGIDVEVSGIFGTGIPELDKRKVMVTLETAQALIDSQRVSKLAVYLRETTDTYNFQEQLQKEYSHLATRNWNDMAFFYHKVKNLYDRIFSIVGVVIVIVVLLSVINTISMTVMERTREIGTMAALGTYPREMLTNFLLESVLIGLIGAFIGVVIAGALTLYLQFANIMMPPPPGMTEGYPLSIAFSPSLYLETALVMIIVTAVGAFFAARKGVRRPIVEALAHV